MVLYSTWSLKSSASAIADYALMKTTVNIHFAVCIIAIFAHDVHSQGLGTMN